jgi:hypothetical protein
MRKGWSLLIALAFLLGLTWTASAGVLSVRVPTKSGIEARFGMVELFTVNWAKNYDFYDDASDPKWIGDPEGGVRDNYMSHMVYFPVDFVKKGQWRAHMLFSYKMSDFDQGADWNHTTFDGGDYDRWRVERAYFEFKLNFLDGVNSWIGVGHDIYTIDRETGALVYFDDDPGIGLYGNYEKFSWRLQFLRKSEQTDSQAFETDSNRDVYFLKLKYDFGPYAKPFVFAALDHNGAMLLKYDVVDNEHDPTSVITNNIDKDFNKGNWNVYYLGFGMTGKVGPVMYQMEGVYQGGNADLRGDGMLMTDGDYEDSFDYDAWAGLINFQIDLAQWIPALNKFVVGLGGIYLSGDDDADDDDLEGFTGITGGTRFFKPWSMGTLPVHGVNQQPVVGNFIYSWAPATSWGYGPYAGGVLGRGNDYGANPGLIAGVFTIDWVPVEKWNVKAMVKYMEWDDTDVIEKQLGDNDIGYYRFPYSVDPDELDYRPDKADDIDEEIGWETDLMVSYRSIPT